MTAMSDSQQLVSGLFLCPSPCAGFSGSEFSDHGHTAPIIALDVVHNEIDVEPVANAANAGLIKGDATGETQSRASTQELEFVGVGSANVDQDPIINAFSIDVVEVAETVDLTREEALPSTLLPSKTSSSGLASGLFGRSRLDDSLAA